MALASDSGATGPVSDRPDAGRLSSAELAEIYYRMLLSRVLDERMSILTRQGRGPFHVSCQGHEAAQVGSAWALRPGVDVVVPYYRDSGVALTLGMTARDLMLAYFARAADPSSGGRQMPNHFGDPKRGIIAASSTVASHIPHAVGVALAMRLRQQPAVSVAYFGEGATSEGDFHEAMNFAAVRRLPVVFFCENNGWAISTPLASQMATASVAEKATAYGMPGVSVDGTDVLAVYEVMRAAVERARSGLGPSLVDARTCRLTSHTSDDDERSYRSPDDRQEAKLRDPVERFRKHLEDTGTLDAEGQAEARARAVAEVADAVDHAERSPSPAPESVLDHVYSAGGGQLGA